MRDRVAEAGGAITVERDRALAVEVRGRLVLPEVVEDGRQPLSPVDDVARFGALPAQVDREAGIGGEERLLPFGVAGVGAAGVGVEQLPNGEAVGRLGRAQFRVNGDGNAPDG
jgi:hypothetical protein